MSDLTTIISIISVIGTLVAIFTAIAIYRRNNRQDNVSDGNDKGVILTEIGYIKSGIDDIKRRESEHDVLLRSQIEKVGRIDESVKSAHNRIDDLTREIHELRKE